MTVCKDSSLTCEKNNLQKIQDISNSLGEIPDASSKDTAIAECKTDSGLTHELSSRSEITENVIIDKEKTDIELSVLDNGCEMSHCQMDDSDEEIIPTRLIKGKVNRSQSKIIDDSSDDENENAVDNKSNDLNPRPESGDENSASKSWKEKQEFFKISDLFDTEEVEDQNADENASEQMHCEVKPEKKNKVRDRNEKTLDSIRQQKENLQEIHSESQRLLRESKVSLPYHQPVQKSLDYFLNRKKNVPPILKPKLHDLENIFKQTSVKQELVMKTEHSQLNQTSTDTINSVEVKDEKHIQGQEVDTCKSSSGFLSREESEDKSQPLRLEPMTYSISFDENDFTDHKEVVQNCGELVLDKSNSEKMGETSENNLFFQEKVDVNCSSSSHEIILEQDKNEAEINSSENFVPHHLSQQIADEIQSLTPRLSGNPNSFISLSDEDEMEKKPTGILNLMQRFMKHTTYKKTQQEQKILMNIVTRQTDKLGKEFLVPDTISLTVGAKESNCLDNSTPSSKLNHLKQILHKKITSKRVVERQKRIQLHELDNEEGFEGKEEEELEEEEEEMTDEETETEEESEESDEEIIYQRPKKKSIFIDDEAEEDDDGDDDVDDENEDENIAEVKNAKEIGNDDDGDANSETADEEFDYDESKEITDCGTKNTSFKRNETMDLFPSDPDENCKQTSELLEEKNDTTQEFYAASDSEIPPHQPWGGHRPKSKADVSLISSDSDSDLFTPFPRVTTQQQKDTYSLSTQYEISEEEYSQIKLDKIVEAKDDNELPKRYKELIDEDNIIKNSQDFDEVLSLCSGKFGDSQNENTVDTQSTIQRASDMDELIALCSGQFDTPDSSCKFSVKNSLENDSLSTEDEILNLCSGKFDNTIPARSQSEFSDTTESFRATLNYDTGAKEMHVSNSEIESENESVDEIDDMNELSDEDEGSNGNTDDENDEKETIGFQGLLKNGKLRREFVEEEAELSGSDVSSDEEEIPEEEDYMEPDEDNEEIMSEDELRNQVGRVHLKSMLDEDERRLRLYQELYLQDGDLHSDKKRERKFRWRNSDTSWNDDIQQNSDNENNEILQEDSEWRLQRCEREKWLCENNDKLNNSFELDDTKNLNVAIKNPLKCKMENNKTPRIEHKFNMEIKSPKGPKNFQSHRGSFLARGRESLEKLAINSKFTVGVNPNAPKHSRNFVFAAISPEKSEKDNNVKQNKRQSSGNNPVSKKQKINSIPGSVKINNEKRKSIFQFL